MATNLEGRGGMTRLAQRRKLFYVHRNPRWERSPSKQFLEVHALEQSGADPIRVLCSMNDTVAAIASEGIRARRPNVSQRALIAELRELFRSRRTET